MKQIVCLLLLFFIAHCSFAQWSTETITKGSHRLYNFSRIIGAPYINLTDSVTNSFDKLEGDLIRWVSRDFSEREIKYYITTKIDSFNCRQIVHNAIWNFHRRSYIQSRIYYMKFKHHYLKPYNYHLKFNQVFRDEEAKRFFKHLRSENPGMLDSLYQQQYDIKTRSLLNELNRIAVADAIYVLGLIDSYKSIPLLESIARDTLMYEKTEIEIARLALARLGNRAYEDSILKYTTCNDTLSEYDCYKQFNNLVYICTQQSASKFIDFLRYTQDGDIGGRTIYNSGETVRLVRRFLLFRKKVVLNMRNAVVHKIYYVPKRFLATEYLLAKLDFKFFDGLDESYFDPFNVAFEMDFFGRSSKCQYRCVPSNVEKLLTWLEDNKENYKLNRRVLF
ncbi:MAG: hypothetical protein J6V76_07165 [Bacteroidales bacterium]|nr:hypothetical protein [Bacteroidales bacterium]